MFRLVTPRWRVAGSCMLAGGVVALGPRLARAQNADTATAEALFEQGRELLRSGKVADACPKLAESERIESSTGTLLALAMCHEADDKLASAWAEFVSVEARARGENRADRERAAHERAQALRPRLSTLEIRVPRQLAATPALEVRRDGALLGQGAWNVAVPVDGASHVVEVSAPGKLPWKGTLIVKTEGDAAVLQVPMLAAAPAQEKGREGSLSQGGAQEAPARWGTLEWAAVGTASAGAVALAFGGYFLSSALAGKSDSSADCSGNTCGSQGYTDRSNAVNNGNAATVFGIAGGVLVAGGATLFIVGRVRAHSRETAPSVSRLAFGAGPAGLGANFSTHF